MCANLSRHESHNIVKAALRAVGNIVTGDDIQTQVILNSGALPHILHLLSSEKESIRKEASWTISNITAGNRQQIQAVIDANIFPILIHILKNDEFKTRKEAAWSITNATSSGTAEQIKYLVRKVCPLIHSNVNRQKRIRSISSFFFFFVEGSSGLHTANVRTPHSGGLPNHTSGSERLGKYTESRRFT